ncbi:MAG: DUF445 family protein [Longimicrobiales bacterium]
MNEEILRAAITIAFGAIAGGLTNTVAIWMLFHPYEAPKLFGRWRVGFFQGAIPKNQPRLASAIGRTVGTRLLTEEDLAAAFTNQEFRQAFDKRLGGFLHEVLERERGPLRELLPPALMAQLQPVLEEGLDRAMDRLDEYLASERFETAVRERSSDLLASVADEPVGGILTPARGEAVGAAVDEWLESAVASEDFHDAVDDYLARASRSLMKPGRTFEEILPPGLVGSVEKAIAGYLPLAIERLGKLLEDPEARARFESTIHDLLHRFMTDLKFHQRVVARLVMTEETVDRVLDTIEREGAERLGEILTDPAVQKAMAKGVNEAIVDFLRRPVTSVLGSPDDENVLESRATLVSWVVNMARDPGTRAFLVEKLHTGLEKAGARTWGEVLDQVPPERITEWVLVAARSDVAGRLYRDGARRLVTGLLDRPIGLPSRWLPPEAPERLQAGLGDPLWAWLETQVPDVVEKIDVARRVEEKVLDFPMPKLEEIVRKVTDRELVLIVRLGYVLGAVIGTILVVVDTVMG